MASKTEKSTVKQEPVPLTLLKKIEAMADSNKSLQKEIKVMSKIFADNQKILTSMKGMIDTLVVTLEKIQKQSKQISMLEEDAQKLYAGLNQVRSQASLVTKINEQTSRLQEEVTKIGNLQKESKTEEVYRQVQDGMDGIRNNSKMIIKIAQRMDEVRDDLRVVSGKTDSFSGIGTDIDNLKSDIESIAKETGGIKINSQVVKDLKQELDRIGGKVTSVSGVMSELDSIKTAIDTISGKASKIDSLGGALDGLRQQFEIISSRANATSANVESLKGMPEKIDVIETEINSLSHRADSTAFVGEGLKSVQGDLSDFKQNIFEKTNGIEQKISTMSDILRKQNGSVAEFHKKTEDIFSELQTVKSVTDKTARNFSQETMVLLKLSEYQSTMRMLAESKYGGQEGLENMTSQTAEIVGLFDKISIESGQRILMPDEVKQWAVSKILDCADRWDVRFGDVYSILVSSLGKEMLKDVIRIQQVRDIYGIRAVDEIRVELGIS